jgi:hypothetical protein
MRRLALYLALALLLLPASAFANVIISVDAAPNIYNSTSGYDSWESDAFSSIFNGTFSNMRNGINSANVGTTDFEIQDEVVYSFGDNGKRLTWIYWIEGETVDSLADRLAISLINIWDGEVLDFYDDYYGNTWRTPSNLVDYDGDNDGQIDGVFGLAGMAWWGAKNINTQEALEADVAEWIQADEQWDFIVRVDGESTSLTSNRVGIVATPEPSTFLLLGVGMFGLLAVGRKRFAS